MTSAKTPLDDYNAAVRGDTDAAARVGKVLRDEKLRVEGALANGTATPLEQFLYGKESLLQPESEGTPSLTLKREDMKPDFRIK